jgi:hypothetical protein
MLLHHHHPSYPKQHKQTEKSDAFYHANESNLGFIEVLVYKIMPKNEIDLEVNLTRVRKLVDLQVPRWD